ncbi:flagellar M-ring protein [Alicyclobacillus contaminans]|nr:flagellar M-ring protein [Alicyclobacillus contaminans]
MQRRNILIAVVAGVVCVLVVLWMLLRPHYVTVMSGLDDKSLGQVDQKLQDLKIPDKIEGTSVLVPAADADKARIQLAMAGLPQSGYIGYSSVQSSFGMTSDQFNIQVLDALQQSLNQTIESIDGIESAQVHIVMPDQQLFVSQPDSTAKASVFVQLGQGVQLTSAQVAGIQQLVAHSVKGLTPDNVTVVDQNGVTLSGAADANAPTTGASTELQLRQRVEQSMQSQLMQGMNSIVGPGNAVVIVHANVSFDQVTSTSHVYQPVQGSTTGLPSSVETDRSSSTTNGTSTAGGVAGQASSNPGLSTYASTTPGGGNSTSTQSHTVTNYDNSYTNTTQVNDPMQVKGYTVSVLLNSQDKQLTPAVVAQIKNFVATSIGNQAGGTNNNISVSTIPFQNGSQTMFQQKGSSAWLWGAWALLPWPRPLERSCGETVASGSWRRRMRWRKRRILSQLRSGRCLRMN